MKRNGSAPEVASLVGDFRGTAQTNVHNNNSNRVESAIDEVYDLTRQADTVQRTALERKAQREGAMRISARGETEQTWGSRSVLPGQLGGVEPLEGGSTSKELAKEHT